MNPGHEPHCLSMLHVYNEQSARWSLARARLRGEERFMFHCPWADHWHVVDKPLADQYDGEAGA